MQYKSKIIIGIILFILLVIPTVLQAHGVTGGDQGYIQEIKGVNIVSYMYLGAKHMVTGYDHILFLRAPNQI